MMPRWQHSGSLPAGVLPLTIPIQSPARSIAAQSASSVRRMPDLLVIGAQKAGTTWPHDNMGDHPDIWVPPIKELHYLNHRFAPSRDGWEAAGRLRQVEEVRSYLERSTTSSDVRMSHDRALALRASAELDDKAYRAISNMKVAFQKGY